MTNSLPPQHSDPIRLAVVCPLLSLAPWSIFESIAAMPEIYLKVFVLRKEGPERAPFHFETPAAFNVTFVNARQGRPKRVKGSHWKTKGGKIVSLSLGWRIARSKPDIVFCTSISELASLCCSPLLLRSPIGVFVADTPISNRLYSPVSRAFRAWMYRRANVAVAYGRASMRYLAGIGYPRARVTHGMWSVPNQVYARGPRTKRVDKGHRYRWISVGRLVPIKGFSELIDAWSHQDDQFLGANELLIVGEGPERAQLEAKIERAELQNNIRLAGYKDANQLADLYASSDIFVFPTLMDVWGLVVNEAMAAGLPILCSKYAGCHEDLMTSGNGELCDPADPHALARAIRAMWDRRERWQKMGEVSRKLISPFTPGATARAIAHAAQTATAPT